MILSQSLIDKAHTGGHITVDDLLDAVPDTVETPEQWEVVLEVLRGHGISVVAAEEKAVGDNSSPSGSGSGPRSVPSDSVALYLQRAGALPLLTAEQEKSLTRCLERGCQAAERLREGVAAEKAEAEIRRRIAEGEKARDRLIRCNLRLVVSIAKRYQGLGLPFLDLIQEGNLGLVKAVDRFDWRRGTRISTCATWWIRHAIHQALNNRARTIRLPSSVTGTMRLIRQARERLRDRLGREPTDAELAQKADVTPDRVQQLRHMTQQVVSLDAPLGGHTDQQTTLGHVIEDRHTPLPMSEVTKQLLHEDMRRVLKELSARERRVLRSRFGLDSSESHTLEEVANEMGVTRERVRQIQGRALRKLRSSRHVRQLRDYWRR